MGLNLNRNFVVSFKLDTSTGESLIFRPHDKACLEAALKSESNVGIGKGKVHPRTGNEGPKRE